MDFNKIYQTVKEEEISNRMVKHSTIKSLVSKLQSDFKVREIGQSVLGKEIFSIEFGEGKRNIILWSQMHGNESTATAAIFDILNLFSSQKKSSLISGLSRDFKITFVPMLNPDGAKNWTRVNALNIDLNRDAVAKVAPESNILWNLIEKLNPEYSFNLHDQRNIFNVGNTNKTATISFLSASFDETRSMNSDRELTMSLISEMNKSLQEFIPGCVGRYTDEFYPTATGDNLHKLGYKNILIESGTYMKDPERQVTRKANYIAILKAFVVISKGVSTKYTKDYLNIPNNSKKLYDLIIRNIVVELNDVKTSVDFGIMYNEKPNEYYSEMIKHSKIENIGDLSQFIGLEEIDAKQTVFNDGVKKYAVLNQVANFKIGENIIIQNGEISKS